MPRVDVQDLERLSLRSAVALVWDCIVNISSIHPGMDKLLRRDLEIVAPWLAGDTTKRYLWYTEGHYPPGPYAAWSLEEYVGLTPGCTACNHAVAAYMRARRLFVFARDYRGGDEGALRREMLMAEVTLEWASEARGWQDGSEGRTYQELSLTAQEKEREWQCNRLANYAAPRGGTHEKSM